MKVSRKKIRESESERLIEMVVDNITNFNIGINLQFWRDVDLYGLSEAITYLKRYCPNADFNKLDSILKDLQNG